LRRRAPGERRRQAAEAPAQGRVRGAGFRGRVGEPVNRPKDRPEPVAVVTGGGSGIGRATVLRLVADGYRVVVADLNEGGAEETGALADRVAGSGHAVAVRTDVRSEDDVAAMIGTTIERF